ETHGWTSAEAGWAARDLLKRHHGAGLSLHGNSRGRIDLHRRLLADCHEHADEPLWERADPVAISDAPVCAPCTADALCRAGLLGWQWTPATSNRWAPDATTLKRPLRDDAARARLIAEARRRQVALRLSRALRLLVDHCSAAIPPAVVADLEAGPIAPFE